MPSIKTLDSRHRVLKCLGLRICARKRVGLHTNLLRYHKDPFVHCNVQTNCQPNSCGHRYVAYVHTPGNISQVLVHTVHAITFNTPPQTCRLDIGCKKGGANASGVKLLCGVIRATRNWAPRDRSVTITIKYSDTTLASQIRAPCECDVVRWNNRSTNLRDAIGQNWAHDVEDAERVKQVGLNVRHRVREFQMHELPHGK